MSLELILLTLLVTVLASVAIIKPAWLFAYPVSAGLLMIAFIVPQALSIEQSGQMTDYDPSLAWGYMTLCMAAILIGFVATARKRQAVPATAQQTLDTFLATYRVDRLFHGCTALVVVGAISWVLMLREAATNDHGSAWTGVITLYALLTSLLMFGASLAWLMYLYTRDRRTLILAVSGLSFSVPTILFAARRELAFELITSLLLGLFFVRGKSLSRAVLIPMVLFGAVFINKAGEIRHYIQYNNASMVGALTSDDAIDLTGDVHTSEVRFAISDIAQTQWSNEYAFFAPFWDTFVQLYFPAFIFGRDAKDGLKFNTELYAITHSVTSDNGATHTGFADSFIDFHYFGAFTFFLIALIIGYYWRRAREGDIGAQFYYMVLLTEGMMTITESTARFVGKAPFLFVVMGLVFWYARRPKAAAQARVGGPARMHAPQLAPRHAPRLQQDR